MKKLITLILALGILLSLCACEKNVSEGNDPNSGDNAPMASNDGESSVGRSENKTQNGSLSLLCMPQENIEGCTTDNGYYYLSNEVGRLSDGRLATHLMYMDFATRQEIYLCNNAACTHNTIDCTSVFSTDDFTLNFTLLFVWNNNLYIISKEQDHDGSAAIGALGGSSNAVESKPTTIYRANLDGTNRNKVYTFDSTVTVEDFVVGDVNGLYFITKKLTVRQSNGNSYTTSSERKLVYLDLSAKTETAICSMDFGDNISWDVIGCSDCSLVLYGIDFGRDISPEEIHEDNTTIYDNSYDVFATLDIGNGTLKEFYRVYAPKARNYVVDENKLYFSVIGDGSITSVDLRNGEQKELCKISQDSIWGMVGGKLYTRDSSDYTYYFIDVNTGEISHSGLVNKSLGWSLDVIAEAGDQVLTIYDYDATAKGDGSYSINGYKYALISKDDLFAGRDNFIPISMIGTGM